MLSEQVINEFVRGKISCILHTYFGDGQIKGNRPNN